MGITQVDAWAIVRLILLALLWLGFVLRLLFTLNFRTDISLLCSAKVGFFMVLRSTLCLLKILFLQWTRFLAIREANCRALVFVWNSILKICNPNVRNIKTTHSQLSWLLEVLVWFSVWTEFLTWDICSKSHATRFQRSNLKSLRFEATELILIVFLLHCDLRYLLCWHLILCDTLETIVIWVFSPVLGREWRFLQWLSEVRDNRVLTLLLFAGNFRGPKLVE